MILADGVSTAVRILLKMLMRLASSLVSIDPLHILEEIDRSIGPKGPRLWSYENLDESSERPVTEAYMACFSSG